MEAPFRVGDQVRLINDKSIQTVMRVRCRSPKYQPPTWFICAWYNSHGHYSGHDGWRPAKDYVLINGENVMENQEIDVDTLYNTWFETKDGRFGVKIAVNSTNQTVLEMKGENGKVEAFAPEDLIEVIPYTIRLTLVGPAKGNNGCHRDDLQVLKGSVEKDDLLLNTTTGLLWTVHSLDTKKRNARVNERNWLQLTTELIAL